MPASTRTRTASSRPYDRRSPTTSPTQSKFHPSPSHQSPPPASPVENPECPPDHPGLPTYAEYKRIEAGYLLSLSPRKRDKALITQAMFDKIWDVLHQPEACTIETPQFRFWVRKMFTLSRPAASDAEGAGEQWTWRWDGASGTHPRDAELDAGDEEEADLELERAMGIGRADVALLTTAVVLHEHRPVAIMEQLYELFCFCHVRAGHGGRDKTCGVIREHYSWVPKELTAQFVKACPTCALKRSGAGELFVMQRRIAGGGKERRQTSVLESAIGRASPSLGWPTTAGPLDPANPQPYGVHDRERLHGASRDGASFSSPVRSPRTGSAKDCLSRGGWDTISGPQTPFHALGTSGMSPRRFSFDTGVTKTGQRSPEKTESLPSLASALSNESLDDDLKLSGLSRNDAGGCLPPALRPLRLSGPVPPNAKSEDLDLFPIDPVLLSFSYPGLHASSPGRLSGCGSPAPTGLGTSRVGSQNRGMDSLYDDRLGIRRVRENCDGDHTAMPALADSPARHFERGKPVDASPSRYGRLLGDLNYDYNHAGGYGYGYPHMDDGPLRVRLLPCRGSTGTESSTVSPGVPS